MTKGRFQHARQNAEAGFTLIEVSVSVVVMMIIAAIAIPSVMQGWNSYRLTSAADSVAGLLERTRFEAIHKNTQISCLVQQPGAGVVFGIDENGNNAIDPGEPKVILSGPVVMIAGGTAPGAASMGNGYAATTTINPPPGTAAIVAARFDARGTVVPGAGGAVPFVLYFGIPNQPTYGYRAVTITPMGQVKTWMASSYGSWVGQ
jgi:prepilin-type N-terminal cleavage/methylation domain-containing protein